MNTAIISGLIILVLLVIMLVAGCAHRRCVGNFFRVCNSSGYGYQCCSFNRSPENFFRYLRIQFAGHSVFYSGRKHYEQGRYCSPSD